MLLCFPLYLIVSKHWVFNSFFGKKVGDEQKMMPEFFIVRNLFFKKKSPTSVISLDFCGYFFAKYGMFHQALICRIH